jgi:hypothetical protein
LGESCHECQLRVNVAVPAVDAYLPEYYAAEYEPWRKGAQKFELVFEAAVLDACDIGHPCLDGDDGGYAHRAYDEEGDAPGDGVGDEGAEWHPGESGDSHAGYHVGHGTYFMTGFCETARHNRPHAEICTVGQPGYEA